MKAYNAMHASKYGIYYFSGAWKMKPVQATALNQQMKM
jgi:hypothetical protein